MKSSTTNPGYLEKLPEFIEILFALIVAAGFVQLAGHFQLTSSPHFNFAQDKWVLSAFVVAYFFIISDWLFYRKLVEKFPYQQNPTRFLIDTLFVFPLMFLLIQFAFLAWDNDKFWFYVFTLAVWHLFVMAWHMVALRDTGDSQNVLKRSVRWHLYCGIGYLALGVIHLFFIYPLKSAEFQDVAITTIRIVTFVSVLTLSISRVCKFILKNDY